jgi:hypothetical protein
MASSSAKQTAGGGCVALVVVLVVVALIVMAIISLAALIDPFDWMPRVHDIWDDCSGDCALAHRFPGFWWHAVANLLYAAVAVGFAGAFLAAVRDVRGKRVARFDSAPDAAAFSAAHDQCLGAGAALGGLALLPILVAVL